MSGGEANVQLRTTHHPSLPLSSAAFMLTDIHHVSPEYVLPPILPCRCNQPQRRRFNTRRPPRGSGAWRGTTYRRRSRLAYIPTLSYFKLVSNY